MKRLKGCALVLMVFSMAAPLLVYGAGEDDDKKQWASVQKLLGSQNYILWYSGLSVSLMALTAEKWQNARSALVHLYDNPASTYAEVRAALRLSAEEMKNASRDLFLAIFQTIDNRKAQMKISINNLYPGDGIETFKYLYKKFGISGSKQSEAHFNLFDTRQMDGETPQDFAERISNINATLADQVPDSILVNLFLKGLWDPGLKTFILQNGQPNDLDDAASSCDTYETRERIINDGPTPYRAFVAWQGQKGQKGQKGKGEKGKGQAAGFKGKGGRGGYGRGGNGRAYGGRGAQSCDLCNVNTHFWRSCWVLMPSLRPEWMDANTHREYDVWCVQCLNRSTPERRRMFLEYRRERNEPELEGVNIDVNGNLAEVAQQAAAQEFPGLVARTHIQPSVGATFAHATEIITLGFAVFAYICHQAKRGLCYFLTGPLMQIALCVIAMLSCMGGFVLFASMMFVQVGQSNGLLVSQFAVS